MTSLTLFNLVRTQFKKLIKSRSVNENEFAFNFNGQYLITVYKQGTKVTEINLSSFTSSEISSGSEKWKQYKTQLVNQLVSFNSFTSGLSVSNDCTSGVDGADGAVGPVGAVGAVGPVGPVGPTGAAGPTGDSGIDGVRGVNGVNGKPGVPGVDGVPGVHAVDGVPGVNGVDGAPGVDGIPGVNGVGFLVSTSVIDDLSMTDFLKVGNNVQSIESGSISTKDLYLAPTSEANVEAEKGNMYFDNTSNNLRYYNGTDWKDGSGGPRGAPGADAPTTLTNEDFEDLANEPMNQANMGELETVGFQGNNMKSDSISADIFNTPLNGSIKTDNLQFSPIVDLGNPPEELGVMYFNGVDNSLYLYDGTSWREFEMEVSL
jgi:hypothetical protein